MTTKSAIPARYTPASPFSMSLNPHDDGRQPVNVGSDDFFLKFE